MAEILGLPKVHFDFGAVSVLPSELAALGVTKPLVITDKGIVAAGLFDKVTAALGNEMPHAAFDGIPENPTIDGVEQAAQIFRDQGCDGIVALGGGSVLDSGKALRIAVTHEGSVADLLNRLSEVGPQSTPYVTIPTTAGTGAEITPGGGIHPGKNTRALSVRTPYNLPTMAICDPDLTLTLPAGLTAATGLDAFGHCLEGYLASKFDPPTEAIALDGMRRVAANLDLAVEDGSDREARKEMLMAALEGGISIHKGLGPVHALAHTFGDWGLHHGVLVAMSMPVVVRAYEKQIGEKLAPIAEALHLSSAHDLALWLEDANARLGIPKTLKDVGYPHTDIDEMAEDAHASYFNLSAPIKFDLDEYKQIVADVLG